MTEYAIALARSPIAPAPPEAELAGWAVSGRRSDAALTVSDWTPLAKVLLRTGPHQDVTDAPKSRSESCISHVPMSNLGVRFGAAVHQTWDGVGVLLAGWGPDEWLALGPPGTAATLVDRLERTAGTVIDVTHGYAVVRVTGARAARLLVHECALDLSDRIAPDGSTPDGSTPDGSVRRTAVSHVPAGLIRDDIEGTASYLITCEWSLGHYVFDSLLDAGNEFGVEVDGLRITQSQWAIRNARER